MGVSLNDGTSKTPQNDHFLYENPWLLSTTIFGNPHMIVEPQCLKSRSETPLTTLATRRITPLRFLSDADVAEIASS